MITFCYFSYTNPFIPMNPFRRRWPQKIRTGILNFFNWIKNNIEVLAFLISFFTMWLTCSQNQKGIQTVQEQFRISEQNRKNDSVGNDKLQKQQDAANAKHDSAIAFRDSMQRVLFVEQNVASKKSANALSKQSSTVDLQYQLSRKLFETQALIDRGKVSIDSISIDTVNMIGLIKTARSNQIALKPTILAYMRNKGKRMTKEIMISFVVYDGNYNPVYYSKSSGVSIDLAVDDGEYVKHELILPFGMNLNNSFYCVRVGYRDELIDSLFTFNRFFQLTDKFGKMEFLHCTKDEELILEKVQKKIYSVTGYR